MGPLVYTSGNSSGGGPGNLSNRTFNGAAGLHQRKLRIINRDLARFALPSMGPLVYTSGNPDSDSSLALQTTPSMGPLVYTSGNAVYQDSGGSLNVAFNGAAGLHQRKRAWHRNG